jgi:hypothetical protein
MKTQDTNRNSLYFNVKEGFCFFYRNDVLKATHIKTLTSSSMTRILKLAANKNFVYEPFTETIFIRRKYPNGY